MWTCAVGERRPRVALDKEVDMADATFTIGAAAACSDGPLGEVSRVVVDPVAREVTHLVIEPEHRSGLARLVPLSLVAAGEGDVRLRCTRDEFEALPPAEETDFLPGGSGYQSYAQHEAYYWPYFGLEGGADPLVANASAIVTRDTLPPGEVGVRRGERVHATDGEIGKVEGLVVDPAHGHVTHVLLQEGHLWGRKEVAIPIDAVTRLEGGIAVSLSKGDIEALPAVEVAR
jgi:sporulation protein YlmC with PRC-barrel domain